MKSLFIALIFTLTIPAFRAVGQPDTTWSKWNWLIGEWVGEGSGTPGQGAGWFSLQPDLDGKILIRKNHAEYPATKDKPAVIHNDLLIVYPDHSGQPRKAIYFDNEAHTIQYSITYTDKSIIFTSEKIPGAPVFRLTYDSLDVGTINVKFEMSRDGNTFTMYTEGKCRKKKS
jgi:hypothetical protein